MLSFPLSPPVKARHIRWPALFNVTDITNSLSESHFKATMWVIVELSKFNTANWQASPLKYKVFDKCNFSTTKRGLWTAVFGLTRLITIFFYWIKERNKEKTIQVKVWNKKVFLYIGKASIKIFVSRTKVRLLFVSGSYVPLYFRLWDLMVELVLQISSFFIWVIFLLFSSILSELLFPRVVCLLFTSAWMQQDKFEYT